MPDTIPATPADATTTPATPASTATSALADIETRLTAIEAYLAAHSAWIEKRFAAITHSVDIVEQDVQAAALKAETRAKALITTIGTHIGEVEAEMQKLAAVGAVVEQKGAGLFSWLSKKK